MNRSLLLFLYGARNIVGTVLALIGLAAFFAGFIKSFWLAIVVGLYAIGYVATPGNSRTRFQLKKNQDKADIEKGMARLIHKVRDRVSQPILERLVGIEESIAALKPHLDHMDGSDRNLFVIKQTVTDYLPDVLETYLSLPPSFARFHRIRGEKTPRDIVVEQLDLLDRELKQIIVDVLSRDTEALIAHGKFLENKFARGDNWLD
ncbi:MAG: hypothetical protein ACU84J_04550 [Gammaproteobacteria bacterium]